jgi:hypothetical protein
MSKKHFLYIRAQSNGCDYTINCGTDVEDIYADSLEEAIDKVIDLKNWKQEVDSFLKKDDPSDCLEDFCLEDFIADSGLASLQYDENPIGYMHLFEVTNSIDMEKVMRKKLKEIKSYYKSSRKEIEIKREQFSERKEYERLKTKFEKTTE